MKEQYRVVLYTSKEQYKKLRIKLLEKGKTVSQWFRDQAQKEIES